MNIKISNCKYCGSPAELIEEESKDGTQHFIKVKCTGCINNDWLAVDNNLINTIDVVSREVVKRWNMRQVKSWN